jgi:hypothetical protein
MDIRDALNDDYLAQFYDAGTLARAAGILGDVLRLEVVHESSSSLTATAQVVGSAPVPYDVQFHAEVNETSDWVFSACSCPVARLCKHGAAVALRLRGAAQPAAEPVWRERLARLNDDLAQRARSTLVGTRLALEISRRPATRWSRGTPGDFSMRPMRPGARKGWVRSGAEWTDLSGPAARSRFVPAQADALQVLHRGLVGLHTYLVAGAAPMLDDYGDRLVPALRTAVAAGVTLLPGGGVDSLTLSDAPARVSADLTTRGEESVLEVVVEAGGRRWRGDQVMPVGRPTTTLVLVEDDDVLLTDLTEPLDEALLDLLLGPPVVVGTEDLDPFLDALGPLSRLLPIGSSDGSLEVPAPPRPRLRLRVTWRSPTRASLDWEWAYGPATCSVASTDPLGGVRDPSLEREILATVPAALTAATAVRDGDALALALHDLPHLRSLGDLDVVEEERPDFRESTVAPQIAFALADEQPDHTDWLDLEVQVSIAGELVPLPDVLAALTREDEFLVLPSGLYVALDRPEFARLQEVVALAAQLREGDPGRVSVGTTDLSVWAELAELGVVDAQAAAWVERATALRDLTEIPQPDPVGLETALRPYQLEGFRWLAFLWDHGPRRDPGRRHGAGQDAAGARARPAARRTRRRGRPFLVVAPTSVVSATGAPRPPRTPPAWGAPRGGAVAPRPTCRWPSRRRRRRGGDDVHAAAPRRASEYAPATWGGLVLDEAQLVKNHQSQGLPGRPPVDAPFKLAVTGTPFENRLMELWSLLSICAPGPLPRRRGLQRAVAPTGRARHRPGPAGSVLRRRLRPLMLRRTKELVAADLPAKQEQVLEVRLTGRHETLYRTALQRERQKILRLVDDIDAQPLRDPAVALTLLRQLALDPALVDPEHDSVRSDKTEACSSTTCARCSPRATGCSCSASSPASCPGARPARRRGHRHRLPRRAARASGRR